MRVSNPAAYGVSSKQDPSSSSVGVVAALVVLNHAASDRTRHGVLDLRDAEKRQCTGQRRAADPLGPLG